MYFIGIDIGSTSAKTAVLDEKNTFLHRFVLPTGWSSLEAAQQVRAQLTLLGVDVEHSACVATGYGRISVPYAQKTLTEITCHARGAHRIFGRENCTVIDIGGQDTKIIALARGNVRDFVMNDKCSAGTGRFLEVMANTLAVSPGELCTLASHGADTSISSMCTVFAESEVISLIGSGAPRENIAFAVVDSVVRKVVSQSGKLRCEGPVFLTGGLCECAYLVDALARALGKPVETDPCARYAGAIGAAVTAAAL